MNDEVKVYFIGDTNSRHIVKGERFMRRWDPSRDYKIIRALPDDVFYPTSLLLLRPGKMIRLDDYLVFDLDLFLRVADNYHWTMLRGIDFICSSIADPDNKAFIYFNFELLARAYKFYDIAPVD
jgi:hypothetical protein